MNPSSYDNAVGLTLAVVIIVVMVVVLLRPERF